jgi:UDP-N-acetylglucosamine 2-epimerase (non-hydrolysing)
MAGHLHSRAAWSGHGLEAGYVLVSLHAAGNVRDPARLADALAAVSDLRRATTVLFVVHPRAETTLAALGGRLTLAAAAVPCIPAVAHEDFLSLLVGAGCVVTDSGGVQDEAAALGIPCFTVGETTARPVTLTHGSNVLLGSDLGCIADVRPTTSPRRCTIPLWDGHAAERIVEVLVANYTLAPPAVRRA